MAKKATPTKARPRGGLVDPMDGAVFPSKFDQDKTPKDFMNGPDGKRPGQNKEPYGFITTNLVDGGIDGKTLPPRSIWENGDWQGATVADWDKWVVSGEGTPGNYEKRVYVLPDQVTSQQVPRHPSDWPKKLRDGTPKTSVWQGWGGGSSGVGSGSSVSSGTSKPADSGLPFGLRVRCPGCGHFFKMDDLSSHSKGACPATQDQPAMWVIECKCHEGDLQMAATVLPGFPVKPKAPEAKAPDTSGGSDTEAKAGDNGKSDEPAEAETGGSTVPQGASSTTT